MTFNTNSNQQTVKKQRDSNFELMRIVAMLLIILHHLCQHGLWFPHDSSSSYNYYFGNSLYNWSGMLGNWLFILVSGYYVSASSFSWKKVFKLWFQIFSISAVIGLVLYFMKTPVIGFSNTDYPSFSFFEAAKPMGRKDLVKSLLPTICGNNWYASTYICFYIFLPFFNLSLKYLSRTIHKQLVITMTVIGTVIPLIWFEELFHASSFYYFILGFYIASYIRLYNPNFLKLNTRNFLVSFSLCIFFILWKILVMRYGYLIPYIKNHVYSWSQYPFDSFSKAPILICAVFMFSFFKNLSIGYNKIINKIAGTTFGVYLIHENFLLNKIIWHRMFRIDEWVNSPFLIFYMIFITFLVFGVCSIIELFRQKLIENPIMKIVYNFFDSKKK